MSITSVSTADKWGAVTPSDSTDTTGIRALYVTVAGNVNLEDKQGTTAIFPVTAGQILPLSPAKVMTTSTTATVLALY